MDETIQQVSSLIKDSTLRELFVNCLPNTLDTTVRYQIVDGQPDTFIVTGDINAMWCRF